MKRHDRQIRNASIIEDFAASEAVNFIAKKHRCSESGVYRIVRGVECATRTRRGVEMKRAERFGGHCVKLFNEGASVDQIAGQLGLHKREVRAAVYMAIKRGEIKAWAQPDAPVRP